MAAVASSAVAELRSRLAARDLHPYRLSDGTELPWETSPAGTDPSLRRFLTARKGSVALAEEMFAAHLVWRRRVFPMDRSRVVDELVADGRRFQRVADITEDGVPVLVVNFLWGYFLEGVSTLDCLRATLIFMEGEISKSDVVGHQQACVVASGGPPPMDWAAALVSMLEANYPERLLRAAVYPVPRLVASLAGTMIRMLDPGTAEKVSVMTDEKDFLEFVRLRAEQLPETLRGGLEGAERQFAPDSRGRMQRHLRRALFMGVRGSADLQKQLLRPLEDLPPPSAPSSIRHANAALRPPLEPVSTGSAGWLQLSQLCCFMREVQSQASTSSKTAPSPSSHLSASELPPPALPACPDWAKAKSQDGSGGLELGSLRVVVAVVALIALLVSRMLGGSVLAAGKPP